MLPDDRAIHKVIFRALRATLGLTAKEADMHLIRAYAEEAAPEPAASLNLCYYYLQTEPGAPLLRETEIINSIPHVYAFVPCRLNLILYGPDCEAWACLCEYFLFLDGIGKPRQMLRECGLYLIPNPGPPAIVYEEIGKKYRKRADLVIEARMLDDSSYGSIISYEAVPVETVRTTPEVKIHY